MSVLPHQQSSDWREAAAAIDPALARFPASVGTARRLAFHGKLAAAEQVLLAVLAGQGERRDALCEYAAILQRQGRSDESAAMRRRMHAADVAGLGLTGPEAEATVRFRCAAEGLGPPPAAAPPGYVAALFDSYAETFDSHLVGTLEYATPTRLADALRAAGALDRSPAVLDLGCGTGLMGAALVGRVRRLVGCDLSSGMIERARARGLYDDLVVDEVLAFLARTPERFGVVACADLFPYLGDLAPAVEAVTRVTDAGGWFAFSAERGDGGDFHLTSDSRYTHAAGYLRGLAAGAGWVIVSHEECVLRRQHGEPVVGHVMVWQRR